MFKYCSVKLNEMEDFSVSNLVPVQLRDGHHATIGNSESHTNLGNLYDLPIVDGADSAKGGANEEAVLKVLLECIFGWLEVAHSPREHAIRHWLIISQCSLLVAVIARHLFIYQEIEYNM